MTASHLPSRDGAPAARGDDASPAAAGPGGLPGRSARLLELTEPGPLGVRWWPVVLGSLLVAGVLTLLLGGAPTYDPWAWIIWGREIVHGDLATSTGPSWKPLPMLFTIPFAFFGDAAPDLWMWVARASALVGIVAVADLAARLGGRLAAALAAVAITLAPLYYAYGIQGSSEGALVLVCSLALTSWYDGRRTASFWWLVAAALLRPEAWFFVAAVGLERLVRRPARIWWLGAAAVLVAVTWLVPEKIGSGAFLRAATRAHAPNPDSAAFASSPTLEVLGSMGNLLLWLPGLGVAVAVLLGGWAWRRGDASAQAGGPQVLPGHSTLRRAGLLLLLGLGWVAIVAAMTEGGYAGNPRYLAAPLGLFVALGIAGLTWVVRLLAARGGAPLGELLVMAGLLVLISVAAVRLPTRTNEIRYQATNFSQLQELAGDARVRDAILACTPIHTHPLMVPPVAWVLDRHFEDITSNRPLRGGTYIVGSNMSTRPPLPTIPSGLVTTPLVESGQVRILQDCRRP